MNANKTFHEVSHSLVHKYQVKEQLNLTAKKLGVSKVCDDFLLLTMFKFIKYGKT